TTYTLRNNSTTNATNVVVSTKIIGQGVYNGGNPGTASIGSFAINAGADATWTVGSLAAGATATLTVNIFTLTASSINTLVQVKSASQTDADSSPNNRTSCPAVEDDEVCSASNSTTPPVQQPDLRITYPSLSGTNYTLGYIFTSNFNVSNIGTGASSGSFLVKYYISSDNTWSSNDIQVGQTTVANSIAAGQSTSGSCSIALPSAPFSTGTYYLFAVVDVPSSITESDENNNTYSQAITITNDTSNLPDLQITNLIAPSTVNISAYYILSYSISNLTNYPTGGSFPIRFVLSTDNTYSANDLLVAEVGAAVGQNSSVIRNNDFIAIPYGTPVGNYYLIGYIDSQNVVSESNENNNTVSQAITVQGPTVLQQIDLIPTTLRTEHYSIYNTNTYYPVQYTVALNGTFSALPGDFVVTYYLSTDNSLSSNDLLVGQHTTNHAFLYTGQVAVGNLNLTLPTTVTSGNYYLFIKVDGSNIIAETNENNNLISGAITVQGTTSTNLPDLTITSLTSAASGAQGNITNYTFNLNNVGTLTASGSYVIGAYLSTDNTLSTNDIQVGVVNTGNTPVGTISNVPGSITVPVTLAPGTYYLILKADINNVITESSETNNTTNAVLYTVTAVGGGNGGG
ncbi:MAG: CARDB domain-containing protein, partial [Saprospiraceae bacterium]